MPRTMQAVFLMIFPKEFEKQVLGQLLCLLTNICFRCDLHARAAAVAAAYKDNKDSMAAKVGNITRLNKHVKDTTFKAEDQSSDSYGVSKSETACVPQAVVSFD
jgi:hypothetical protein